MKCKKRYLYPIWAPLIFHIKRVEFFYLQLVVISFFGVDLLFSEKCFDTGSSPHFEEGTTEGYRNFD